MSSSLTPLRCCDSRQSVNCTAHHDYEIVAGNLLHGDRRRVTDRVDCYALYIDPSLGRGDDRAAGARLGPPRRVSSRIRHRRRRW
ncbi:MAG: hypothetical protein OXP69_18625 [Spirochaetaceae bacterium]|nr:hypothetical protein [Spirochaetaceae bacterium]